MDRDAVITRLSALAHTGRLDIFRLLVVAGSGGVPAGEIARRLQVVPNTLSANLRVLNHAGLIDARRDGRSIIYSADFTAMTDLLGFLVADCCAGDAAICAPLASILNTAACRPPATIHG